MTQKVQQKTDTWTYQDGKIQGRRNVSGFGGVNCVKGIYNFNKVKIA